MNEFYQIQPSRTVLYDDKIVCININSPTYPFGALCVKVEEIKK